MKKSQIRAKNVSDLAIRRNHLSGDAINKVLESKFVGMARTIPDKSYSTEDLFDSGTEMISGYESGSFNFKKGIEVEAGNSEIDITSQVFENSFVAHATINNTKDGILLSGQSMRWDITNPNWRKKIRGETLFSGLQVGPEPGNLTGYYLNGQTQKFPVIPKSFKVYNGLTLIAFDDGNGNILGAIAQEVGTNFIDYDTGMFSMKFTTLYSMENISLYYKQTSFQNYKVWVRNSETRLPFNNGQNKEVFGELYVEEVLPITLSNQTCSVSATRDSEAVPNNMYLAIAGNYPFSSLYQNYLGTIAVAYDGTSDLSDEMIGMVKEYDSLNNRFSLKYPSEINHFGQAKFIRYKLRFWTYGTNWNEVPFFFTSDSRIDVLFLESSEFISEEINNIYNYKDFFKVVDTTVQTLEIKGEERMTDEKIIDASSYESSWDWPIVFPTGSPLVLSGGYEVDFIDFKVANSFFKSGSLEVYIDGVAVFHYQTGDDPYDVRIIELNNGVDGEFRLLNIDISEFSAAVDPLASKQIYVRYIG
jgi:hypothetical protein